MLKGMPPEIIPQGPYPIGDPYGMAIAVDLFVQSQHPGKSEIVHKSHKNQIF